MVVVGCASPVLTFDAKFASVTVTAVGVVSGCCLGPAAGVAVVSALNPPPG